VVTIDVAIPAYADRHLLRPLLEELNTQAEELDSQIRVIISDDGSPTSLEELYPSRSYDGLSLTFVRGVNAGPGAARNRAIEAATSDWIVFLDADTVPSDGWYGRLFSIIEATEGKAIEGVTRFAGGRPTPFAHATEIRVGIAHGGANIAYELDTIRALGGFDEAFYDGRRRMHFREDLELYFRASAAGVEVEAHPELEIAHPPLRASYWTPVRLARRYYFDPLLDRKHPEQFRTLNKTRKIGPISLRSARHWAAVAHVVTISTYVGIRILSRGRKHRLTAIPALIAWGSNIAALAWGRTLRTREIGPLVGVSFIVPWVYVWHFGRGVLKFKHIPRL